MLIKVTELNDIIDKILTKYGYLTEEAEVIKKILLYAQLRGNNQGVVKLIGNGIPKREGNVPMKILKETPVSALVDGGKNHAMLVMERITDIAIEKAKISGIAITGNFNTSESTGALGYYVEKIAKEGLIGYAYASSPFKTTAPFGSSEAMFCTNPMAYGIPTNSDPIIIDFTTSAMAYYGLIEAKTAGKQVGEGIGYDSSGNDTTDPAQIMDGALKTIASHKGSALALLVQVIAGALIQADSFDNDSDNSGNTIITINPEILTDTKRFKDEVSSIVNRLKNARKIPGVSEILIPGERGNRVRSKAIETGEIEIEGNLYKNLIDKLE